MLVNVIDSVLPEHLLRAVQATWPAADWSGWHRYNGPTADKFGSLAHAPLPPSIRVALERLAMFSGQSLPDGSFIDLELHAAGLHQIPPGGFLGRHLDAECHPLRPWRRTHSIVLFVDSLADADGGELFIEPDDYLQPVENRMVIFETPGSWHQVLPTSATAPMRRTLALFAWRAGEPCRGEVSAKFEESP